MKKSKLTVRVSENLLEEVRQFAINNNTTMTSLVETFLRRIISEKPSGDAPIVQRLTGILPSDIGFEDYKTHLDEKYGG